MGGSAGARVRVSIVDLTTGLEVGGSTSLDANDSVNVIKNYDGNTNRAVTVNLTGGHRYLLRYAIATSVSNYSPQFAQSEFYQSSSNRGVIPTFTKVIF